MIYMKDNIDAFIDNWFIREGDVKLVGFFRAKVVDNVDPLKQNQVKVYIPELMKNVDGIWARPIYHFKKQAITPQIGDYVIVTFESGDLQKPVYIGHVRLSCPSKRDQTCGDIHDKQQLNVQQVTEDFWLLETPKLRRARLSDSLETIQIASSSTGRFIEIDDKNNCITIVSKNTNRIIKIDDSNNQIEIKTPKSYIVLDDSNDYIKANIGNSSVTLTSSTIDAKVSGSTIHMDGSKIQLRSNVILLN